MSIKSISLLLSTLVLSILLLTGCGGGGGSSTTPTDTTPTNTTPTGTGEVTFSGAGLSVISTPFIPTFFAETIQIGNSSVLFWANGGIDESQIIADITNNGETTYINIMVFVTDNVVTEIGVSYTILTLSSQTVYSWIIDDTMATINSTYDGTTVTFAGETLFEESGAAGNLVINGSLGK